MPYKLVMRWVDYPDDTEIINAKNKDEVIEGLLWILNRNGIYTEIPESDY